jgi:hypothetical protein
MTETGDRLMDSIYDNIVRFMEEYISAYNEYGQVVETFRIMDKFYAPELSFPDDRVTSREQWYKRCLAHPAVQDKLTIEHLVIDEKQREVVAYLKTQAIDRTTSKVLVELKFSALYTLEIDQNKDINIIKVKISLGGDPSSVMKLAKAYNIGAPGT